MWSSSCSSAADTRMAARRRRWLGALGAALGAALCPWAAHGAVPAWREALPSMQLLGAGRFRWFGLGIYDARLWSRQAPFDPRQPFVLELSYLRHISRERLVQTSLEEIVRLGGGRHGAAQLARWESDMRRAFTDVAPGDLLAGLCLPGQGARFYRGQGDVVEVPDPAFADAFFAIWLDPRSRDRALRAQLLGMQP